MYHLQKLLSHQTITKTIGYSFIFHCKYWFLPITKENKAKLGSFAVFIKPHPLNIVKPSTKHISADPFHIKNKYFSMASANEEFRHLDYEQLNTLRQDEKVIVIDVREKYELAETGVIPGAQHIPVGELAQALSAPDEMFKNTYTFTKPSADAELIFSCRSGKRSLAALEIALASGYKNAKHYKGGWLDWEKHLKS